MQGNRAHRSDFKVHTDEELVSMQQEDVRLRQEEDEQQLSELTAIASLNDHPGWKMMKVKIDKKIADYRSGQALAAAILDAEVTNEKLGELTRTTNLVATELETILMVVEASAEARKEQIDGRPQRRSF